MRRLDGIAEYRMEPRATLLLLAAFALPCVACATNDDDADVAQRDTTPQAPLTEETLPVPPAPEPPPLPDSAVAQRPETRSDTILLEGMPEPITVRLVRAPDDFDVPFTTYVPEGIDVRFDADSAGDGVRFAAAFTGTPDENAYMHVRVYREGTPPLVAEDVLLSFLTAREPAQPETEQAQAPGWADDAWSFRYDEGGRMIVGRALVARHGARVFHVITHYPAEYGDGLGPRFAMILDEWRWEDTGRMLRR